MSHTTTNYDSFDEEQDAIKSFLSEQHDLKVIRKISPTESDVTAASRNVLSFQSIPAKRFNGARFWNVINSFMTKKRFNPKSWELRIRDAAALKQDRYTTVDKGQNMFAITSLTPYWWETAGSSFVLVCVDKKKMYIEDEKEQEMSTTGGGKHFDVLDELRDRAVNVYRLRILLPKHLRHSIAPAMIKQAAQNMAKDPKTYSLQRVIKELNKWFFKEKKAGKITNYTDNAYKDDNHNDNDNDNEVSDNSWKCKCCTFLNDPMNANKCELCDTQRTDIPEIAPLNKKKKVDINQKLSQIKKQQFTKVILVKLISEDKVSFMTGISKMYSQGLVRFQEEVKAICVMTGYVGDDDWRSALEELCVYTSLNISATSPVYYDPFKAREEKYPKEFEETDIKDDTIAKKNETKEKVLEISSDSEKNEYSDVK